MNNGIGKFSVSRNNFAAYSNGEQQPTIGGTAICLASLPRHEGPLKAGRGRRWVAL